MRELGGETRLTATTGRREGERLPGRKVRSDSKRLSFTSTRSWRNCSSLWRAQRRGWRNWRSVTRRRSPECMKRCSLRSSGSLSRWVSCGEAPNTSFGRSARRSRAYWTNWRRSGPRRSKRSGPNWRRRQSDWLGKSRSWLGRRLRALGSTRWIGLSLRLVVRSPHYDTVRV